MSKINLKLPADLDIAIAIVEIHNFTTDGEDIEYLAKHYLLNHISMLSRHITVSKLYKRDSEVAFYKYLKRYLEVSSNNPTSSLFLAILDEISLQRIDIIL